jgi:hypothetical protein
MSGDALRTALERRDSRTPAPRFSALWPQSGARRKSSGWLPVAASALSLIVVAGLVWNSTHRPRTRIDPSLVHQLSSAEYWRVPTDEVLVYQAAPLRADLPAADGLQISLEESLL